MTNSLKNYRQIDVVFVDGMNLLARNYHGISNIQYDGKNMGAFFGTARFIMKVWKELHTHNIVFIWEGKNSWRKQKYPFYKSNRTYDTQNDFYECVRDFQKVLPLFGATQVRIEGFEADDTVGYLLDKNRGKNCVIVSNDWDWWAYLNDSVQVWYRNGITSKEMLSVMFERRYGVVNFDVTRIGMFKVFTGDKSDGISGVPRFPRKFAAYLAMRTSSVDGAMLLLKRLNVKWFKKASLNYTILKQNYELIHLNKLVDVDVEKYISIEKGVYNKEKLIKEFNKRGMVTLSDQL